MKTTRIITATAITAALLLAGCSTDIEGQANPIQEPTQETEEVQEPEPEEEPTEEADITEVEQEPEPLEPGDIVAEDEVQAAREDGATVYVSPNGGGTGLVIDPEATELPDQVRQDVEALPGRPGQDASEAGLASMDRAAQSRAMEDAGLVAFYIGHGGQFEDGQLVSANGYVVSVHGIDAEAREFNADNPGGPQSTKGEAIALKQPLIDRYPDAPIIDLTD